MAKSFGCSDDTANEVVQEMYVRICKYVDDPKRILYKDSNEVNGYYVYLTLRNIYLTEVQRSNKMVNFNSNIDIRLEEADLEERRAFDKLVDWIDAEVKQWYWYDRKIWEIHFDHSKSMRSISKDTTISLSSIFNTIKKCKNKIRDLIGEDVEDYKNGDYDRI